VLGFFNFFALAKISYRYFF